MGLESDEQVNVQIKKFNEISLDIYDFKSKRFGILDVGFADVDFKNHLDRFMALAELRYEAHVQQEAICNGCLPKEIKSAKKEEFIKQIVSRSLREVIFLKNNILEKSSVLISEYNQEEIEDELDLFQKRAKESLEYFEKISSSSNPNKKHQDKGRRVYKCITGREYSINKSENKELEGNSVYSRLDKYEDYLDHIEEKLFPKLKIHEGLKSTDIPIGILSEKLSEMISDFEIKLQHRLYKKQITPARKASMPDQSFINKRKKSRLPVAYFIDHTRLGSDDKNTELHPCRLSGFIEIFQDSEIQLHRGDFVVIFDHGAPEKSIGTNENISRRYPHLKGVKGSKVVFSRCHTSENEAEYMALELACENNGEFQHPDILYASNIINDKNVIRVLKNRGKDKRYIKEIGDGIVSDDFTFETAQKVNISPDEIEGWNMDLRGFRLLIKGNEKQEKPETVSKAISPPEESNQWKALCMGEYGLNIPLRATDLRGFMPQRRWKTNGISVTRKKSFDGKAYQLYFKNITGNRQQIKLAR